ncbi:MAG: glycosyltransferase family 4 protein [Patescibacteria group bacterium]|nr:glycosyltransferase family 4 protein [Patescibacteria group bacterium]
MKIGVDGNEANVEEKVGVSVYTLNLLKYFRQRAKKELQFTVYLKSYPRKDLPASSPFFRYEVIKGKCLWSQVFLPIALFRKKELDVFFSPAHYLPRFLSFPSVVTIHDLSFIFYPKDFLIKDLIQLRHWTSYSVRKATKVIAVSQTTKKDLLRVYRLPEKKIQVIYNGFEKRPNGKSEELILKDRRRRLRPFLLYVGTLQPRKNLSALILAFEKLKYLYPEFELIIAGKKGWLYHKIFTLVSQLGLEKDVYFTDYISDNQLIYLYKNAFCFVLPSFYEGFGIPILEAMSYGCPVIASFSSSLPEVGADACLYFDPTNPLSLFEKIKSLIEQPALRETLIKKGYQRVKEFSWEKCGQVTLTAIIETVKGKKTS